MVRKYSADIPNLRKLLYILYSIQFFSTLSQNQRERCAELTKAFCYRNVDQFDLYDGSILKGSAEDVIKV